MRAPPETRAAEGLQFDGSEGLGALLRHGLWLKAIPPEPDPVPL